MKILKKIRNWYLDNIAPRWVAYAGILLSGAAIIEIFRFMFSVEGTSESLFVKALSIDESNYILLLSIIMINGPLLFYRWVRRNCFFD